MKSKTTLIIAFLLTFAAIEGYSQTETKKISFMKKHFFHVLGGSIFLDGGYTPFYKDSIQVNDPNGSGNTKTVPNHKSDSYVTLVCIEYEPRFNLLNYKDFFSISFNMPIITGLQFFDNEGFGAFKNAYILDLNFCAHSTYNNTNKWGGHIGTGLQMTYGPIFYKGYLNTDRVWTNWIFRGGLKFPFKSKLSFLDFAFGPGKTIKHDPSIVMQKTAVSKVYFGVYAGILLGYE